MTYEEAKRIVQNNLSKRELLELLAEEASELSQAALKLIRASCGSNNVTPKSEEECTSNLMEEIGDVLSCVDALNIDTTYIPSEKWKRWADRINKNCT